MGELAEFAQSAGGGVAFQGVNRPADDAHDFRIARTFLQLEGFFVERLQQFSGSLEEELLQFCTGFVCELHYSLTSMRW